MSETSTSQGSVVCRGVRGATTIVRDEPDLILSATRELLALMIRLNGIETETVASAIFTLTPDLHSQFPALAARQLGWFDVPLLCTQELGVPGAQGRCIRILIHWNTTKTQSEIIHVYLKEAQGLRPDRQALPPVDWQALEVWIEQQLAQWQQQKEQESFSTNNKLKTS